MDSLLYQSGVIPYRETLAGLEVMMITSTSTGHWQFPKGMLEPDMTPAESAEKEAEEEAGVLGIVVADPVSVYRYDKRGVWPAEVVLYPMRVLRELDEDEWEEAGLRQRQWVDLDEAERRLYGSRLHGVMRDLRSWLSEE